MNAIDIRNLTKDYGSGRGVFDVTLKVEPGEVYGYLGPNGAGKSTTIRHLMGFMRPQSGQVLVEGRDCWKERRVIQKKVGYLPGEIAFPEDMTGKAYLRLMGRMRKMKDFSRARELLEMLELDPDASLKRMSKGMKQKTAIVAAFMDDPDILLLDEPSSGLDPLMQNRFIELVEQEKARGKTILLSSHIFDEVEKTCDRIGMIKNGRLIRQVTVDQLRRSRLKTYRIQLMDVESAERLRKAFPGAEEEEGETPLRLLVSVGDDEINGLIAVLAGCRVGSLEEKKHTLEEYFMKFYGGDERGGSEK